MSTPTRFFAAAGLAALLAGCSTTVGPDFTPPAPPTVQGYAMAGDAVPSTVATLTPTERPAGAWWTALGSPALDAVIAQALKQNPTLAEADATLESARQDYIELDALHTPQIEGTGAITRQRINTSSFGFSGFASPTITLYQIGANVLYDLDLFGSGRRGREAARARIDEEARRADAAYLTLTGKVALEAVRIAALKSQIAAARAVLADGQQTLEIARKAEEAGAEAPASLAPGEAQVAADRAQIPPLEAELARARHALALLVGQPSGAWTAPEFDLASFTAPARIPVSLPSELVRRRPDILAAEAALHAATADIGVETAKLYPSLRLAAGYNQGALDGRNIFNYDSSGWNFGPQLSVPLLDGGRRKAGRDSAVAEARAADARYRQTVLTAFTQVADALDALGRDDELLAARNAQVAAAQSSFDSARKAYDLGGGTLLAVVDAQRQLSRARRDLAQSQGDRYAHVVQLFTAVAADWRTA